MILTIYQFPETSIYPDWSEAAPGSDWPASSSSKTDDTPLLCAAARQRGHWELFSRIGTTQARWKTWEQGSITSKDKSFVTSKPQTVNTSMVKTKRQNSQTFMTFSTLYTLLWSRPKTTPLSWDKFQLTGSSSHHWPLETMKNEGPEPWRSALL